MSETTTATAPDYFAKTPDPATPIETVVRVEITGDIDDSPIDAALVRFAALVRQLDAIAQVATTRSVTAGRNVSVVTIGTTSIARLAASIIATLEESAPNSPALRSPYPHDLDLVIDFAAYARKIAGLPGDHYEAQLWTGTRKAQR